MKSKNPDFFDAILERRFGASTCFLCGSRLSSRNRANEHVIPKWAQKKYGLYNQSLVLLNHSTIPYRNLTIPCCYSCNNLKLQPIERRVQRAISSGHTSVKALAKEDLFVWLGKIFYGLLYRELLLPMDRTKADGPSIIGRTLLKKYSLHHMFLQSVRVPMTFSGLFPASILVFKTQEYKDPRLSWDMTDNLQAMTIMIRAGSVGIVGALQEGGIQQGMFKAIRALRMALHPIQAREVFAQITFMAMMQQRDPKFLVLDDGAKKIVVQPPIAGFSKKPIFRQWDKPLYARYLSRVILVPLEQLFRPPDQVATWLYDEDGRNKKMPIAKYPYP